LSDLESYIESGILESYLLGLATRDEVAMLERMRRQYPQLNGELATMEYKLQRLGEEGCVAPPAQVWDRISERISWETPPPRPPHGYTYIIQQSEGRTMTISSWWRCVFIGVCVLTMALLASNIYFYKKYAQLERHILHGK
jgi:anti-sigma-K factor RskA